MMTPFSSMLFWRSSMMRIILTCALAVVLAIAFTPSEASLLGAQGTPSAKIVSVSQPSVCVVQVGTEKFSGFVIAHNPPIVATVAHSTLKVQKLTDITIRINEKGTVMTVKAFHVHPGYNRKTNPFSPDVAVLELNPNQGKLGSPLLLAKHKSGVDVRGAEIVSLGFPFYSTRGKETESPEATARKGLIRRMLDYDFTTTSLLTQRPIIEHDLGILNGESGAPIMLIPSGEVIGVQHGIRRTTKKETNELLATLPVAIHVDELWSLLNHARLTKFLQR